MDQRSGDGRFIGRIKILKTYDTRHPHVNHRGLLALNENADEDDDEQLDDLSDREEDKLGATPC